MTITEFILHPLAVTIYWPGVVVGIYIALCKDTKKEFMKTLVFTSIWPAAFIGLIFYIFYDWYTGLKDE